MCLGLNIRIDANCYLRDSMDFSGYAIDIFKFRDAFDIEEKDFSAAGSDAERVPAPPGREALWKASSLRFKDASAIAVSGTKS